MSFQRVIWVIHLALFLVFGVAAAVALWSWRSSGELDGMIVAATVAAFAATTSAFVERIFPKDG